ncbi:MAG: sigma-70 family RNA polymerase sigma factor [Bacteroidota bacterium]
MTDDLERARQGDINAFQRLFAEFQDALKSYLFRMLASRADAEDIAHDTFIRAFDKLSTFREEASLKTWTFRIATNLAHNVLSRRRRWDEDVSRRAKELVLATPQLASSLERVATTSPFGRYEIREHIDTCFTCIAKCLPVENQVTLLLKDVYDFKVREIMHILGKSEGTVKYLLQNARKTLSNIFDRRCALVNKQGTCHQCSELNGWFNPKQDQQEAKMKLRLVQAGANADLLQLRTELVKAIDPLRSDGHELQQVLLNCNRLAMGEQV